MKTGRKLFFALAFMAGIFVACNDDEDLNTSGESVLGVRIEALNTDFNLPVQAGIKSVAVDSESIVWDSAHLVVSEIKFEAELKSLVTGEDSIEMEYKWFGPEMVDLLNNELTMGNFILQPGYYDEIELKVSGEQEDAGNDPVFYLEGIYTNNNGSTPIVVMVNDDVYFKTEKENVEVTEEEIDFMLVIQLYLDELMADVDIADLDAAELSDGVLLISADKNTEIHQIIVNNLEHDQRTHYKHKHHDDDHHDD
ncbi:hypothetical protein [Draconibacterium halophilum]|uniref:DUF4382 domain-containing protein n=1 Tax=Draconibacterium halophilum TaxID=2706887 RepID=A0A6C0R8B0_9BACT|nr:hypothetical protein [Draconibacterium halophilum]QIA06490.1 hypothetical protein G0Q07_01540 [Draconibacterium halophilum]